MKIKSQKGYTGIDIAISVVVLFIFVSIIATLSYNFNSSAKQIELEAKATQIAVNEIEKMKNIDFEEIKDISGKYADMEEIEIEEGFYKNIIIQDYADIENNKIPGLVKKVTVQIKYMFKTKEQVVELSTVLSK